MCDFLGKNMLEFPDCGNFNMKYPGLSKKGVNIVDDPPGKVLIQETE
jgi:hypothetical protein